MLLKEISQILSWYLHEIKYKGESFDGGQILKVHKKLRFSIYTRKKGNSIFNGDLKLMKNTKRDPT